MLWASPPNRKQEGDVMGITPHQGSLFFETPR